MIIQPLKEIVVSSGNMVYCDNLRSWKTIKFKREFVSEFPQLQNKRLKTKYLAVVFHSYNLFEKEVSDIITKKKPLPVMLFFEQDIIRE